MGTFDTMVESLTTHVEAKAKREKTVRESAVERHLHAEVSKAGGTTRKFKSPGRNNVPDRIVIWPGDFIARIHFVEMKAFNEEANDGQKREHIRLRKLGCTVLVLDTKQKVDDYVARQK